MQRDKAVEIIGKVRAPFGLADGEGLLLAIVGHLQMVDAGEQRAELLAVVDDAADRDAAKADAMIAALATDQPHTRRIALHVVIGERDLERGVDGFRAGIAEENVVEIAGRQRGDAARQFERLGMGKLKSRRVIECCRFLLDRRNNRFAVMAGIRAPEPGRAVEELAPVAGDVMHVLGADDDPRPLLEGAVGRERHPIGFEVVGDRRCCQGHLEPHSYFGLMVRSAA